MILQTSYVNKKLTGDDTNWNVFSKDGKILFVLDRNLTERQVSNTMKLAKEFERKSYVEGIKEGKKSLEKEIIHYKEQLDFLMKRNNILSIKIQNFLEEEN